MTTSISVGIIGFSLLEETKLKKIFELSHQHQRAYQLSDMADNKPVDLLLIKQSDEWNVQQHAYLTHYKNKHIPIVATGRELNSQKPYYIKGVLVPSRVFAVLDQVEIKPITPEFILDREEQTVSIENQNQQSQMTSDVAEQEASDALKVLVVDDSVMMQKTVQLELNKASVPLQVDFADTGEIALEKVKQKKYDFIFLDVMMPGIDGFETCSQIRKLNGMAKTPIIMLTSKTSPLDEVKGLMAGCTTYLTKPFEHEEFQKMLERIMQWVKEFNEKK